MVNCRELNLWKGKLQKRGSYHISSLITHSDFLKSSLWISSGFIQESGGENQQHAGQQQEDTGTKDRSSSSETQELLRPSLKSLVSTIMEDKGGGNLCIGAVLSGVERSEGTLQGTSDIILSYYLIFFREFIEAK